MACDSTTFLRASGVRVLSMECDITTGFGASLGEGVAHGRLRALFGLP